MRNLWYKLCDTVEEFKENRTIKRSFGWDVLDILSSDAPILECFFLLVELVFFFCVRKKRR